jgi:hypothetical protein
MYSFNKIMQLLDHFDINYLHFISIIINIQQEKTLLFNYFLFDNNEIIKVQIIFRY